MKYKKIFKNILDYFKFEYYSCNFEEIVSLIGKNGLTFEISIETNHMSLALEMNGVRENYGFSKLLTKEEKQDAESIMKSFYDTKKKLELLCNFFDNYRKRNL